MQCIKRSFHDRRSFLCTKYALLLLPLLPFPLPQSLPFMNWFRYITILSPQDNPIARATHTNAGKPEDGVDLRTLRAIRVLRPLKLVSGVPSKKSFCTNRCILMDCTMVHSTHPRKLLHTVEIPLKVWEFITHWPDMIVHVFRIPWVFNPCFCPGLK